MELERSIPSRNLTTGYAVEKQIFTWTIPNFPAIRQSKAMINSQKIDFIAGTSTSYLSHWTIHLEEGREGDNRWIGIYMKPEWPKPTHDSFNNAHSRIRFKIRNKEGEIIHDKETRLVHIATTFVDHPSWGFRRFIDPDDVNFCPEEDLVIEITFKLFTPTPSQPKSANSLEAIMEKFQVTFFDNLRRNLAGLLSNPVPCTDIKIVANDKKEFTVQRGILAVRSEVFAAMLSSDMMEANSGVIQLPDISSKALKVLVKFLYIGELLPEWRESEVILELTNAAAKYQLRDLLQFLDQTQGKVCKLDNAVPLLVLARQLSLKVAEEELMLFARKEWMGSADSFLQRLNSLTTDEADEPEAKRQKLK